MFAEKQKTAVGRGLRGAEISIVFGHVEFGTFVVPLSEDVK